MNDETRNGPREQTENEGTGRENRNSNAQTTNGRSTRFPFLSGYSPPETARDPLLVLKEILTDKEINDDEKRWLLGFSATRFRNRRRIAYMAMIAILASLAFLLFGSIVDGIWCGAEEECIGILESIKEVQTLVAWIEGFLASIVATYYGISSFRPSS